jgi:hypothetical protein
MHLRSTIVQGLDFRPSSERYKIQYTLYSWLTENSLFLNKNRPSLLYLVIQLDHITISVHSELRCEHRRQPNQTCFKFQVHRSTSYPGLVANWWQRRSPGKRRSRVRQILQDSWSISLRAGFMKIKTGGTTKSSRMELELPRIIYILLFFVVIFLFSIYFVYILEVTIARKVLPHPPSIT